MIIRILHEGQYELDGKTLEDVRRLDLELLQVVASANESGYQETLGTLLATIRKEGRKLGDHELKESHLIVPGSDFHLDEARALFKL